MPCISHGISDWLLRRGEGCVQSLERLALVEGVANTSAAAAEVGVVGVVLSLLQQVRDQLRLERVGGQRQWGRF